MSNRDKPRDLLLQSQRVRSYLLERCSLLQVDIRDVAKLAEITDHQLALWMNTAEPEAMVETMPQDKVLKMLSILGVEVQMHLVSSPLNKMSDEQVAVIRDLQSIHS